MPLRIASLVVVGATAAAFAAEDDVNVKTTRKKSRTSAATVARQAPTPVAERPRPAYDALGQRYGDVIFFPSIMASAAYDDNIFAQRAIRARDTIFTLMPASFHIDWYSSCRPTMKGDCPPVNSTVIGPFSSGSSPGPR